MLLQFIQYSILAGVLTHPIWVWNFKTTFIPKPSDFFFGLAIVGALVYFLGQGRNKLAEVPKLLYTALFLFGASIILGTIMGYLRYGIAFMGQGIPLGGWHLIFYHLFRIGGGFVLLVFVYISLKESIIFRRRLYHTFWLSAVPFIPFLLWPSLAEGLGMVEYGRFMGLAGNTGMFAILIFPAFVFALFLFLRILFKKTDERHLKSLLLFFLWMAMTVLILWSASRVYFGAMIISTIAGTLLAGYLYGACLRKILLVLSLLLAVYFLLFFFSPTFAKFKTLNSELAAQPESVERVERIAELQVKNDIGYIAKPELSGLVGRRAGFEYYISIFKIDPLIFLFGLGPNYISKFYLKDSVSGLLAGQSIIFDIFLYGGVSAFTALALLAWLLWRKIRAMFINRRMVGGPDPIYVLAPLFTLLGWWTAAVFLGTPFTLVPNWILLGMILVARHDNQ